MSFLLFEYRINLTFPTMLVFRETRTLVSVLLLYYSICYKYVYIYVHFPLAKLDSSLILQRKSGIFSPFQFSSYSSECRNSVCSIITWIRHMVLHKSEATEEIRSLCKNCENKETESRGLAAQQNSLGLFRFLFFVHSSQKNIIT